MLVVTLKVEGAERAPFGYVLYNYEDDARIGHAVAGSKTKNYFCTDELVGSFPNCTAENVGKLLYTLEGGETAPLTNGKWIESGSEVTAELVVPSTGYYCVRLLNPTSTQIHVQAEFLNSFGKLPSEYRPLMTMSLVFFLIYLGCFLGWSLLLYRHHKVIVNFQKYVAGMLGLSALEMGVYYLYYSLYNASGEQWSSVLSLAAIVGATRMTASLFILLLVCMGYGTVLPSLEGREKPIYSLSVFYLVASVINVLTSLSTRTSGQTLLLISNIGIIFGGAVFITWIFDSMKATCATLLQRKQYAKLSMYQKLNGLLGALYYCSVICMFCAILYVAGATSSQAWYATHWEWLWFMTDGWQSLLNLVACLGAAYIFRPRSDNRTYGMNQLAPEPLEDLPDEEEDDLELARNVPEWARKQDPFGEDQ